MLRRRSLPRIAGTAALLLLATEAMAQSVAWAAAPESGKAKSSADVWKRKTLFGDLGGLRTFLGAHGATLGIQETSEIFGNASGGIRRGADYDGMTQLTLGVDTQKAFGWAGGKINASALQIHGRNLSAENLDNLQTISGIEAMRSTRLWELWYQQKLPDRLDVRIGQQSLDQEFITSQGSSLFVNTMMGWPMVPSADLYAGGPAYPLSSLGARLRAHPTSAITLLAGVFDDNPPGGSFNNDSQLREPRTPA